VQWDLLPGVVECFSGGSGGSCVRGLWSWWTSLRVVEPVLFLIHRVFDAFSGRGD